MMLGISYKNNLLNELFIRTMNKGTYYISDLRNKYSYISDTHFAEILYYCSIHKIIKLDLKSKKVYFSEKMFNLIRFIEKYDFVNNMQKASLRLDVDNDLKKILDKINFFDRILNEKNNKIYINLNQELNNCMILEYGESFNQEINALNLKMNVKKEE